MDRRPKRRIWSGDDYDSDHEDEKPTIKPSNLTDPMRYQLCVCFKSEHKSI